MNVHIVAHRTRGTRILDRLIGHLSRLNAWSVGTTPDPTADVNVFFPYLEWRKHPRVPTPTAAWFTHREVETPAKVREFDSAAESVGLRITPARLYAQAMEKYGPTVHIPHPVELDKFIPAPRPVHRLPRIGVSGWVYGSGRKGEHLVKRLHKEQSGVWDVCAAGRGWPIQCTQYPWIRMEKFYQSLDVFLCTSSSEGGPVTMLEAMACGVPVVIPSGVGQCDEFPEERGIYHYQAGDYDAMLIALEQALLINVSQEAIRAHVMLFTPERWAKSWNDVLETWLYAPRKAESRSSWTGRAGIFVVAFGEPSRECARRLLVSCREHMPGLPVAVVSDRPLDAGEVFIKHADGPGVPGSDIGGRSAKTRIWDLAPAEWEYVAYLDADCELTAPVLFLFDALADGWDMLICINPGKYHVARMMQRPDNEDECKVTYEEIGSDELIQLQGGVFSFHRNERTEMLFRAWHEEWQRWGKRDQGALLRAMHKHPVQLYLLPVFWNGSTRYPRPNGAAILHHQTAARRHRGIVQGRNDSDEAWDRVAEWEQTQQ